MKTPTILHITNSYGGTRVFQNLYTRIDELGFRQFVAVPLNWRNRDRIGSQRIDFNIKGSRILFSSTLRWFHKYLFSLRIRAIVSFVLKAGINPSQVNVIHASTLCLDGAVAYKLWRKYKIPYIISIRNTDINVYYRKLIWKRRFFHKILNNAKGIVNISPNYQSILFNQIRPRENIDNSKCVLIPNGVDDTFLRNRRSRKSLGTQVSVLYTGGIQRNKNIVSTIKAIERIREEGISITYTIIGYGLQYRRVEPEYERQVLNYRNQKNWIKLLDWQSADRLRISYADYDIFVMPSYKETFGLSYIEALSQGLPVVYSKGQGIDGFFENGLVGLAVDPSSVEDIAESIKEIIANYGKFAESIAKISLVGFDWMRIAEKYRDIYLEVITTERKK